MTTNKRFFLIILFLPFICIPQISDQLIKADKHFINGKYAQAASVYEKYLEKNQSDFHASRMAGLSYNKLNQYDKAIDHWTKVYDNSQASESDKLEYGKCLLANYRTKDARMVFMQLGKSKDPSVAAWAKAYQDPEQFYKDSSRVRLSSLNKIGKDENELGVSTHGSELFFSSLTDEYSVSDVLRLTSAKIYSLPFNSEQNNVSENVEAKQIYNNTLFLSKDPNGSFYKTIREKKGNRLVISTEKDGMVALLNLGEQNPTCNFLQPCFNSSGNLMFFVSDLPGGSGGLDIWISELKNGQWNKPYNAGPEVNSSGNELFPFYSGDNKLYYSSDKKPGLGGFDIFVSESTDSHTFSEAKNVGAPLNSQFDDHGLIIHEGKGFLSSNRKSGGNNNDIYSFKIEN